MSASVDSSTIFRVDGIVAVITGGGSGIGLTMTRALAANGASKVYILGRRLEVLETAAAEFPGVVIPHQADVTSKTDLQAVVDRIKSEVGYVNLVVANSGSIGPPVRFNPAASLPELRQTLFTDFSMEGMNDALNLNITAAFFTMTAFLELLDAGTQNALRGGFGKPLKEGSDVPSIQSQVIFTTSISAFSRHWSSSPPYLTSKVAIMQVTKHASTQLAKFGIRVNAIAPGIYPSELASVLISTRKPEEEAFEDQRFIPARRFGGDEEMAGAILYLTSRAGSYSNGSILVTDGGRLSVMTGTY
ncbi:short-chain dehydrogenase [Aspergillus steynii IBT 23096]|uniref:Short-chain dehydrogenase n=1 Tax=Aspergillus steynii IBT 23096 TaxID=1392250 RepID=A0A2I2FUF7_9EURO|nr:short-chain dehydrogenase [Aspergillus steynii IBT 23096]PLB44279.1 short-chain dehydrogenase [Aspergillus steynii IBT 23096]